MRSIAKWMLGSIVTVAMSASAPDLAAADCTWSVTGQLSVEHQLSELQAKYGGKSYLKGIKVKVSAKEKIFGVWGTWNSWGEEITSSSGSFSVTKTKNCNPRRFKAEVKFQSDDLEVRYQYSTSDPLTDVKWYTIYEETEGEHDAGTLSLGEKTFSSSGRQDLNDWEARRHADIWVLYQLAIEYVASLGSDYQFTTQIKVKYPHDGIAGDNVETSYANPTTKVIYIVKNSVKDCFNTPTLLHELGHIWAYNHTTGEICLTETLLSNGSTHGLVDDPCTAFHEGFADWWMDKMTEALFGTSPPLPYNRAYLSTGGLGTALTSLSLMQRHDDGWISVFHTLTTKDLHRYTFKESGSSVTSPYIEIKPITIMTTNCSSPDLSFKNVLRVFNEDASAGYPSKLSRDDTTIDAFLTRVEKILSSFTSDHRDLYKDLVDPSKTVQPSEKLCTTSIPPPPFPGR